MKKNKILVLLLSLSLVFFYSCKHPSGTDLPNDPSAPESPADPETPGDPENPGDPTNPTDPENPGDPTDPADPENPGDPTDPADPENPGDPEDPAEPEKLPDPETGVITITAQEGNDFVITESESDGKVVLTADKGYSDYKWYVDADSTVVSETDTYEFTPSAGCTMVFVTAKKDGAEYSATYYIFKK